MSVNQGARPAFGKMQGYHRAAPASSVSGGNAAGGGAKGGAANELPKPSNYDEIVGNAFQNNYHADNHTGIPTYLNPVKGLRWLSGLIDLLVLSTLTVFIAIIYSSLLAANQPAAEPVNAESIYGLLIILFILWAGYGFVMEVSKLQGTVGKIATGTVITNEDGSRLSFGQVLGRNFGKLVSYCTPFYIAYFMVLFSQNNQSLHDYMCGSFVYKKSDVAKLGSSVFD